MMPMPSVGTTTLRLYERLPAMYRTEDEARGWPFLSWLDGALVSLETVDTYRNNFMYIPASEQADWDASTTDLNDYGSDYLTSQLLDGSVAEVSWLPWLLALVGADINSVPTEADRRAAIVNPFIGWQAGSRESLRQAALDQLSGTKYLRVFEHSEIIADAIVDSDEWHIVLVTKQGEAAGDLVAAIEGRGAKPAGIILQQLIYGIQWAILEIKYPTWNDLDGIQWGYLEGSGSELT